MKFKFLLLFILLTTSLVAQNEERQAFLTLEYHHGINANAYTFDEAAEPFLDEGIARNLGMDMNFIIPFKKRSILQFSASWSVINHIISPPNLIYEFDISFDDDCCLKGTSFLAFTGGVKYGLRLYEDEKLEILGAVGLNLNMDIYTTFINVTFGSRRYWSSFDNKTAPALFGSVDLSTRLNYHLTKKLIVTSSISFVHTPFYALDFTYTINSRDGIFTGLYYQRLSSVVLSVGLGWKL